MKIFKIENSEKLFREGIKFKTFFNLLLQNVQFVLFKT